ncbi:relaxase/mobilization nuclease domain-containing protein, partial [Sinorhizobium meliloti]|uniref:relaxase/mobilization nuclease domain-containing protein n=1 Tax=Rhizobium meliloti TaxID=382 RepID=UPI0012960BF2
MNFAKGGSKNTGKGASFKKALQYYLHDKRPEGHTGPHPETSERVGFVVMENLPPVSPGEAWEEMKFLANAAPHIKESNARAAALENGEDPEAAAKKTRAGRKCTQPLYVYSLNWHRDDAPTDQEMLAAARESLALLGLQDHQAVIVQHTDQAHKHVHIAVNRVNPETGVANPLSNDEFKLDEWAFNYEIERGIVRSPDRYLKHMEAMRKKDPERYAAIVAAQLPGAPALDIDKAQDEKKERKRKHQQRDEWSAKKEAGNDNAAAKAEAAEIKKRFNDEWKLRKQRDEAAYNRRRAEMNAAWRSYQNAKRDLWQSYEPQISGVWKRPRRGDLSAMQRVRAFLHDPAATLRDARDRREWKALGRRQWQDRRAFQMRERTVTGAIGNAIRLSRVGGPVVYRGRLAAVFHLSRNADERRRLFELQQETEKKALRDRHNARKKLLADPIKAKRQAELDTLAAAYQQKRAEIEQRHAKEQAGEKAARAVSNLHRSAAWTAWREKFKITDRPGYTPPG